MWPSLTQAMFMNLSKYHFDICIPICPEVKVWQFKEINFKRNFKHFIEVNLLIHQQLYDTSHKTETDSLPMQHI